MMTTSALDINLGSVRLERAVTSLATPAHGTLLLTGTAGAGRGAVICWDVASVVPAHMRAIAPEDRMTSDQQVARAPRQLGRACLPQSSDVFDVQVVDERFVAAAGSTGVVAVLNLAALSDGFSGEAPLVQVWALHHFPVRDDAPAPCNVLDVQPHTVNPLIASAGDDGMLHMSRIDQAKPVHSRKADSLPIVDLAYLGHDQLMTLSSGGQLKLWDLRQAAPTMAKTITDSSITALDRVTCVAAHMSLPDTFASGGKSGQICKWDLRNPASPLTSIHQAHEYTVNDLKFHPTAHDYVMSCGAEGRAACTDVRSEYAAGRSRLRTLLFDQALDTTLPANCIDVVRDVELLVYGTDDGVLLFKHLPGAIDVRA